MKEKGYIPGPCLKAFEDAGWSATPEILGVDGKTRRMLYFHAFKAGQPSLNWTSPTATSFQLILGDIAQSLMEFGAGALRLDATPFCGIVVDEKIQTELGSPISILTTKFLSSIVRKSGGWSYQELNVPLDILLEYSGTDFFYDFFSRPAVEHAALTGDASFLFIMNTLMHKNSIKQKMLIHDTQCHDEITYGLPQLDNLTEKVSYHGKSISGLELKKLILKQKDKLAINSYNKNFGGGVSTTMAGYFAAGLGVKDINNLTKNEIQTIKELHLLIIMYNALQPGIFGVSGWDLIGALPISSEGIEELVKNGDTRWHNRGAYDILDLNKTSKKSITGIPKCKTIYGSVPEQLKDPDSFCSNLQNIIDIRTKYKIQLSDQIAVPKTANLSTFISIQSLPENKGIEVTALNFGNTEIKETVDLENSARKLTTAYDALNGADEKEFKDGKLIITIPPRSGKAIIIN